MGLRSTVGVSKHEVEKLKKDNQHLKEKEEKASKEISLLQEEISSLTESLQKLKSESEENEKRAESAEASVVALQKQSEDLLLEYDRLLEDNQNLQSQFAFRIQWGFEVFFFWELIVQWVLRTEKKKFMGFSMWVPMSWSYFLAGSKSSIMDQKYVPRWWVLSWWGWGLVYQMLLKFFVIHLWILVAFLFSPSCFVSLKSSCISGWTLT